MKYYAMIDGEQRGPFTLDQLPESGITPETYVWRKGYDDWVLAADDADICRYYRQRLAGIHSTPAVAPDSGAQTAADSSDSGLTAEEEELLRQVPPAFRRSLRNAGIIPGPAMEDEERSDVRPMTLLPIAILATLLCFPLTGLVAIFYSYKSMKQWKEAEKARQEAQNNGINGGMGGGMGNPNANTVGDLQKASHESARKARMWLGITFFMGMIMFAFVLQSAF